MTSSLGVIILLDVNSLIPSTDQVDDMIVLLEMFLTFIEIIVSSFSVLTTISSTSIGLSGAKVPGTMDVSLIVEDGSKSPFVSSTTISFSSVTGSSTTGETSSVSFSSSSSLSISFGSVFSSSAISSLGSSFSSSFGLARGSSLFLTTTLTGSNSHSRIL